jgi:hypothetical protein
MTLRGPLRAAVVAAGITAALGFLPLFAGVGYELSFACGLFLPSLAAIDRALALSRGRPAPSVAVRSGATTGLVVALVAVLVGLLHGLRVQVCDLWGGLAYFALTAGAGAVLGGVWGALVAEVARGRTRRKTIAVALAFAGPLACALVSVGRFATSPMIFAFDPFVGYFSGTLYDTVVEPGPALLWYRVGTAATLVFAFATASLLRRSGARLRRRPVLAPGYRAKTALALAAFAVSAGITAAGVKLGHWSTAASIAADLGARKDGDRCTVLYPANLREDEGALLLKDCEEELAEVEAHFGVRGPERLTAYFFRDAGDKKRLMGAADTYIAKPWRDEVYLQLGSYPHPVLGHEIAHVVAGRFGNGPFKVAGELGGLIPNPGLIEGVAVAASPDEDELTDETWARAMLARGTLPPMRSLFGTGFLAGSAAKSYTLAGAFVRFLEVTYGMEKMRAWYAGATVEATYGKSLDALDGEFRAHLQALPANPAADAWVQSKFERPSIWGRRCPHEVDALKREADQCQAARRLDDARKLYRTILARDPHEWSAQLSRAGMEARFGDRAEGRASLRALAADESATLSFRNKARESLADQDLLDGHWEDAALAYRELAAGIPDEDTSRTLEIKAIAALDPDARRPVALLLVGEGEKPSDGNMALGLLTAWETKTDGAALPSYLVGKNLVTRGYWADAAQRFDRVLAAPESALPIKARREAFRQRAVAACALGDAAAVARLRALLDTDADPFRGSAGGRADGTKRLLARCRVR